MDAPSLCPSSTTRRCPQRSRTCERNCASSCMKSSCVAVRGVGLAVPEAAVGHDASAEAFARGVGQVAPAIDRSQSFMQQHER